MKQLALVFVVALLAVGCTKGTKVKSEMTIVSEVNSFDINIKIVRIQGHDYMIFDGYKQGGICHSESCPCKSK